MEHRMDEDTGRWCADEGIDRLRARVHDLMARAARGMVAVSPFLTPREVLYAARCIDPRPAAGTAVLFGGYPDAERKRLILLPDYCEGLVDSAALARDPAGALSEAGLEDLAAPVRDALCLVCVRGSGYRALSHRDYLGAVLGLGLDRDAVGDILTEDGEHPVAYLFTDARLAAFLCAELTKVANDTVRVSCLPTDAAVLPARRIAPVSDTIASDRLDCVVAALCRLSRDKAQSAIRQGLCELDYEPVTDCDRSVVPPATVSVRGYGKFAVESFDGETRKGRLRLRAAHYL